MPDPTNQLHCPHCNQTWPLTAQQAQEYAGRTINCTACGKTFTVPANLAATSAPMLSQQPIAYATPANAPQSNGLAIASLVCGLLLCVPIIPAILAIVFGVLGINKAKEDPRVGGGGLAIAGLTLGIAGLLITAVMWTGVLFPSIGPARETANRVQCASNMRQIGLACVIYANQERGRFPASLEDALAAMTPSELTSVTFCCPATNDTAAPGADNKQQAANLSAGGHLSYVYLGNRTNVSASADTVLMYEPMTNHHSDGMNVLFADCHVEFLTKTQAQQLIAQIKPGSREPIIWPPPK